MLTAIRRGKINFKDLGINAHIVKPVRVSDLLIAVQSALGLMGAVSRSNRFGRIGVLRTAGAFFASSHPGRRRHPVNQKFIIRILERLHHNAVIVETDAGRRRLGRWVLRPGAYGRSDA